jgi:hypothetical protein
MPRRTAFKLFPQGIFLPVDDEAYEAASRQFKGVLLSVTTIMEDAVWLKLIWIGSVHRMTLFGKEDEIRSQSSSWRGGGGLMQSSAEWQKLR